ncbi:MAG: hypothetical protein M3Q23_13975 [Actinomycetota bacterium]|nr:hypothetical protein [Actinomycetota bacterium]
MIVVVGLLALMLAGFSGVAWAASIQLDPTSGPGGTQVTVTGSGFAGPYAHACPIWIGFTDANGTITGLAAVPPSMSFQVQVVIPAGAAVGAGTVRAVQNHPDPLHLYLCIDPLHNVTAPFTVTSAGTQLLGNSGFENGSTSTAPWVTTARINNTSAEPPHSGTWDAWLGGTGTAHTDSLYQDVTIPSGITSGTLTFWLHVDTADAGSPAHDLMKLQVRTSSNVVLATLATYSNLNAAPAYAQKTFDLTSYAGQTIRVFLGSKEDASLQTSFLVDDFALTAI